MLIPTPVLSRCSFSGLASPDVFICSCLVVDRDIVGKGVLDSELSEGGGNREYGVGGSELS